MRQGFARLHTTRRGAVLLLFGAIYIVIGVAHVLQTAPDSTRDGYSVALIVAPLPVWGIAWIVVGLVGIVTAWWPPNRDTFGFGLLASFTTGWALLALCSSLLEGSPRGWYLAAIWGTFAAALTIVSGMDRNGNGERRA